MSFGLGIRAQSGFRESLYILHKYHVGKCRAAFDLFVLIFAAAAHTCSMRSSGIVETSRERVSWVEPGLDRRECRI